MNDMRHRLARCFSAVFPDLRESDVYRANISTVANWDSTAAIMLASVIEEEFKIPVDYDVLPQLVSFDLMLDHLTSRSEGSA